MFCSRTEFPCKTRANMVRGDKIYYDAFVHENESEGCWVRFMTSVRKCRTHSAVSQCHWLRKAGCIILSTSC